MTTNRCSAYAELTLPLTPEAGVTIGVEVSGVAAAAPAFEDAGGVAVPVCVFATDSAFWKAGSESDFLRQKQPDEASAKTNTPIESTFFMAEE